MSRRKIWTGEVAEEEAWDGAQEFKDRVRVWAARIGVTPSRVQIQRTARKWGSCSPGGVLTFSSQLLTKPRRIGEAVIVHELVHLKVANHGPVFRSLAEAYFPGASDLGRWEVGE